MPHVSLVTPGHLKIANEVIQWAEDFLVPDNPEMKRPVGSQAVVGSQSVCPFIRASLDNDAFYMVFHPEVNGLDEDHVEQVVRGYLDTFIKMPPHSNGEQLKALLVIFTKMEDETASVLTKATAQLKSEFVNKGLMLAPFYKKCQDKSVHNPSFLTSQAPYPLIAIRHMALHDILFLDETSEWFDVYNRRFGSRFNEPTKIADYEKPLLAKYQAAKRRHLKS